MSTLFCFEISTAFKISIHKKKPHKKPRKISKDQITIDHCIIGSVCPSGHWIKPFDKKKEPYTTGETMKQLSIIPLRNRRKLSCT